MYLKIILFLLTGIHFAFTQKEEYVAGVVECFNSETPEGDVVAANFEKYKGFITEAAGKKCNILVLPEVSLAGNVSIKDADLAKNCTAPSEDTSVTAKTVMQQLSCLAKANSMLLVFNSLAEECVKKKCSEKDLHFVYGQDGSLKDQFPGITPKLKVIDTDYGKFALVCEKDLFMKKLTALLVENKIKNVISTISNRNNAPLYTAVAMQAGWAYAYDITLLAAGFGYNSTKPNVFGTGIYMGKKGPIVTGMTNKDGDCKMSTATVKKEPDAWAPDNVLPPPKTDKIKLVGFKQENINATDGVKSKKLCHRNFCCNFDVKFTKTGGRKKREDPENPETPADPDAKKTEEVKPGDSASGAKKVYYRIMAYSGKFEKSYVQVCSVIACLNEKLDTCDDLDASVVAASVDSIKINGIFAPNAIVVPMVFNRYYLPLKVDSFEYKTKDKTCTLTSKGAIADFSSFGIIGQNTSPNLIGKM